MTLQFEIPDPEARRDRVEQVLARAAEAGIETVRLSFADQHGLLRGKTLPVDGLRAALDGGCPMTSTLLLKDTSHRTVFPVWTKEGGYDLPGLKGAGDIVMLPDPATFQVLPWAPTTGWLLCDLYLKDGTPLPFCTRSLLRRVLADMAAAGFTYRTGLELEFTVLKLDDPKLAHADAGHPPAPFGTSLTTRGYQYLTESRADELDPVFEIIRKTCAGLHLPLRSLEVEFGPSQVEATFHPQDGMATADATVLFRSAIKQALRREGYHATFMCRPALPEIFSNGWHVHQSLIAADGSNAFAVPDAPLSPAGYGFVAGLLERAAESCLMTTPTINGYKRYRPFVLAPDRILWGLDNKGAMLRVVGGAGDAATRIENRAPEPAANPYLCLAAQAASGLDGIRRGTMPPPPTEEPYAAGDLLPRTILQAIDAFAASDFYRRTFGDAFVDYLTVIKKAEVSRFFAEVTDWEQREYFEIY
ncbi:MAG: glutamine synthetase [Alphaproteobacteria bacterium]|nr:glutamine synthetase [Alphaproteobacteria bacterium]MBO6865344.1 glutamine synthetase [Alphaproteobacteria bacterium]